MVYVYFLFIPESRNGKTLRSVGRIIHRYVHITLFAIHHCVHIIWCNNVKPRVFADPGNASIRLLPIGSREGSSPSIIGYSKARMIGYSDPKRFSRFGFHSGAKEYEICLTSYVKDYPQHPPLTKQLFFNFTIGYESKHPQYNGMYLF